MQRMAGHSLITPYAEVHKHVEGPGDGRPTAQQIIEDESLVGRWPERTILITGGSSGIGLEVAKALHTTGARIFITARDSKRAETAVREIMSSNPLGKQVEIIAMELGSLDSVKEGASDFLRRTKTLNVLINNAGVMAAPFEKTKDGFESQFAVNHLSHFLLTKLLLPTLVASSTPDFASRIVNVSSSGHVYHNKGGLTPEVLADLNFEKTEYNPWRAYGQSKTANVLHANQLERLYGSSERPVHAFSLHPGGISTPLWRHQNEVIQERVKKFPALWKSPEQGAATLAWCATAKALEGRPGRYCENCGESGPLPDDAPMGAPGYAAWTYDEDAESGLWDISERIVASWL